MGALNINDADLSNQIGALPTIGGVVTIDAPFKRDFADSKTYSAIYIKVGTGAPANTGTLILEDYEGKPVVFNNIASGDMVVLAKCKRVLSTATTPSGSYTTSCTNLTWLGGSR